MIGIVVFILGLIVGVFIGLCLAALMVASGRQADAERKRDEEKLKGVQR